MDPDDNSGSERGSTCDLRELASGLVPGSLPLVNGVPKPRSLGRPKAPTLAPQTLATLEQSCAGCADVLQEPSFREVLHLMDSHFAQQSEKLERLIIGQADLLAVAGASLSVQRFASGTDSESCSSCDIGTDPVANVTVGADADTKNGIIRGTLTQDLSPQAFGAWSSSMDVGRTSMSSGSKRLAHLVRGVAARESQTECITGLEAADTAVCDCSLKALRRSFSNQHFDIGMGFFILVNAIMIGYQADHETRGLPVPHFISALESAFAIAFTIELALRVLAFGSDFIAGHDWKFNLFDSLIVLSAAIEETMRVFQDDDAAGNLTFLRIMRLLKLVRVLRIIRVIRFFRELRMMVLSIAACFRSLFWTMVLLSMVMFVFAIGILTSLSIDQLSREGHFKSLPGTILTLFQSITGGIDWADASVELADHGWFPVLLFILYIGFVLFAVMNILTSFFVEQAIKAAETDLENTINEQRSIRRTVKENLRKLLMAADDSHSGRISWQQVKLMFNEPAAVEYFKTLQLEEHDVQMFFELVADGDGGSMSIDHFVRTCLRLKGPAKNADLLVVRQLVEEIEEQVKRLAKTMTIVGHESGRELWLDAASATRSPCWQPPRSGFSRVSAPVFAGQRR